jgi:hypothetical protein
VEENLQWSKLIRDWLQHLDVPRSRDNRGETQPAKA